MLHFTVIKVFVCMYFIQMYVKATFSDTTKTNLSVIFTSHFLLLSAIAIVV